VDVRTVGLVVFVSALLLTLVLVIQFLQNRHYRGLGLAALGQSIMTVAFGSIVLNTGPVTGKVLSVLGVSATVISVLLVYAGTVAFLARPVPVVWLGAVGVFTLAVNTYFVVIAPDLRWRRLAVYLLVAGIQAALVHALTIHTASYVEHSARYQRAVFAIGSLYYFVLAMATLLRPDGADNIFAATPVVVLAYLGVVALMTLWTFGLVFMVAEHLRFDLAEDRSNLRQIFQASPDATAISRLDDGLIIDVNEGFTRMLGFERAEAIGRSAGELGIWALPTDRLQMVESLERDHSVEDLATTFKTKAGDHLDVAISARLLRLGGVPHLVTVTRDVTVRKRLEDELRRQALTDELTGIPNRRAFFATMPSHVGRAALVVVDLDGFKQINDTFGHAAGDEIVRAFARLTTDRLPPGAELGRIGGDEFAVLLPGFDVAQAQMWTQRLLEAMPSVTFSAGVAVEGDTVDELMAAADQALYEAKLRGRNCVVGG
jgi:diguanylate cyclase (GGDEF)-like protein/PAS domain S-box-containing protein